MGSVNFVASLFVIVNGHAGKEALDLGTGKCLSIYETITREAIKLETETRNF